MTGHIKLKTCCQSLVMHIEFAAMDALSLSTTSFKACILLTPESLRKGMIKHIQLGMVSDEWNK